MEDSSQNLYQQLGIIQGTLASLGNTVTNGFNAANKQITDFKDEFRVSTSDQNIKIDSLSQRIEHLEQFKANYDGAREEARRNARYTGGMSGGIVGTLIAGLIELIKYLLIHKP